MDESHFSSASQLDECRREAVHLSFGVGPHHCLGASLARAEAFAALQALLARTSSIRRSDDDELPWHASYVFHGTERLPVQLAPAHG